jgi:hypothetical protein
MKQLELDFLDYKLQEAEENYGNVSVEFPESELDSAIISYQTPYSNGFSVLNAEDNETWFTLIVEFVKVLNKAGFQVDVDQIEKWVESLEANYQHKG